MVKVCITAVWDDEAGVWSASSEDVPGLATEAPDQEQLLENLKAILPELIMLNGVAVPEEHEVSFSLLYQTEHLLQMA